MPKRKPLFPPIPQKSQPKKGFSFSLFLVALFCTWFIWASLAIRLPERDEPPLLYSNQCQQDIRSILLSAIRKANSSVRLVMFGLSDRAILSALGKKIKENVPTTVYYDTSGSPNIFRHLQGGEIYPIKNSGLMHQKILILDREQVFIGSANMTSASLRMHDNLVVGLMSRTVAKFLEEHEPYSSGYLQTMVGGQAIELWLLPDPRGHVLADLRKKVRNAKRSIQIALFTFTHLGLIDEVIEAHQRGVQVTIVVDMHSGMGASSKAIEKLKKAGIPVFLSQGVQLLHHKFIYIDEQTLITGSANWTKAAFYKNSDCILALHHLNPKQKKFMKRLWRSIEVSTQRLRNQEKAIP